MNRIYIIGPRASGKTTLGHGLARALKARFVDTDIAVGKRLGCSIAEYVGQHGWPAFRSEEHAALEDVVAATDGHGTAVIATGGGIVLLEENRRLLRETGTCLYIDVPIKEMVRRLSWNPLHSQRPSLTGQDIRDEVTQIMSEREHLYRSTAHYVVSGLDFTPSSCEIILSFLTEHGVI
ncbi:MAG: shikimate kinase AroL [Desulfovibrionaceae bacterium]|nr:shikimate kinase AroL [Desulfovibrionaceae bacterium]